MIVVHLPGGDGEALPGGVAHVVVEDKDAAGAQFVAQQALDLRVVDVLDLVARIKSATTVGALMRAKPLRSARSPSLCGARV